MQQGNQQLDRNHMIKVVRRDIARIKTILTQKQKGEK
jgi:ribosomal protein L29